MIRVLTTFVVGLLAALAIGGDAHARAGSGKSTTAGKATVRHQAQAARAAARPPRAKAATRSVAQVRSQRLRAAALPIEPVRPSVGQQLGLHGLADPLSLKSSVAYVIDADTNEVLFSKNPDAVLPIASITKLMTALLVVERQQPLDELLTISDEDIDTEKGSRSRLSVGTQLSRGEMLHLALMASENRAANALGRHYPGGLPALVAAMNRKAASLGMHDTRYVEPTGLSSQNQSSARDLAVLVRTAHQQPLLRELSTSQETQVSVGQRVLQFRNTNGLVNSPVWDIGLQKTGYISEAGRCVVMQARLAGRKLIMVLLDSAGKYSRFGDAERIRRWLAGGPVDEPAPRVVRRRANRA
jgi:serine-type D-Ala-D-Ala endopeptidase (penicillin-binding protein 7)